MSWLYLVVAIALEAAATMSLRASDGLRKRRWAVPVVGGYALAFCCLGLGLNAGLPLGVAYGVWVATGVAVTAVLARVLFRDPLTPTMVLGIVLIAGGVLAVELGATAA